MQNQMKQIKITVAGSRATIHCTDCKTSKIVEISERFDLGIEKRKFAAEHRCEIYR